MFEEELRQELSWREVAQTERGEVAGFLIGRSYPDAWHLMDLAVAPWARRRGVAGRTALRAFVRAADEAARPVFLEVRPRNAEALALYAKWGFSTVGSPQALLLRHRRGRPGDDAPGRAPEPEAGPKPSASRGCEGRSSPSSPPATTRPRRCSRRPGRCSPTSCTRRMPSTSATAGWSRRSPAGRTWSG